jgi:CheY-like chemotaxis protein
MKPESLRPILFIEDCDEDFESLCIALEELGVDNPVRRCVSGKMSCAMFNRGGGCAQAPESALILLDLNLPGADGRELLSLFRQRHADVPVVVFSTSGQPDDRAFCLNEGASDYLVKPLEYDRWRQMIGELVEKFLLREPLPAGGRV